MKLFLFCTITFLLANDVYSIVCPHDYCDTVKCVNEISCPETHSLLPTFCGCCNRCAENIPENGTCFHFLGTPSTAVCAQGLQCCSGTCQSTCGNSDNSEKNSERRRHHRRH